jgi:hypothetical protein
VIIDGGRGVLLTGRDDSALIIEGRAQWPTSN